jgi:hypothetical protein
VTVLRLEYESLWRKNSLILKYFSTQNHRKVHASRLVSLVTLELEVVSKLCDLPTRKFGQASHQLQLPRFQNNICLTYLRGSLVLQQAAIKLTTAFKLPAFSL